LAALALGGLVFVRLSDRFDNGFPEAIRRLNATHVVVPGYEMHIRAPPALIVENGFDEAHFYPVEILTKISLERDHVPAVIIGETHPAAFLPHYN
jgi:hypothetical protein